MSKSKVDDGITEEQLLDDLTEFNKVNETLDQLDKAVSALENRSDSLQERIQKAIAASNETANTVKEG
eukprot:Clim_evm4s11 gene=Clim_evmTU4s11